MKVEDPDGTPQPISTAASSPISINSPHRYSSATSLIATTILGMSYSFRSIPKDHLGSSSLSSYKQNSFQLTIPERLRTRFGIAKPICIIQPVAPGVTQKIRPCLSLHLVLCVWSRQTSSVRREMQKTTPALSCSSSMRFKLTRT